MLDENILVRGAVRHEILITAYCDENLASRILDICAALNILPEQYNAARSTPKTMTIALSLAAMGEAQLARLVKRIDALPATIASQCNTHVVSASEKAKVPLNRSSKVTEQTGADLILATLAELGVDTVFGYPGGAVLPLYDALYRQSRIKHVLVRHEQAAVHAAEGYARSTGKVGVCLVTSGPGATNTITGLTDALMDSVPVLCLSGQVASPLLGTDAFQEANVVSLMRAATKHNALLTKAEYIKSALQASMQIARSGKPGPVALDIPKDLQAQPATYQVKCLPTAAIAAHVATEKPVDSKQVVEAVRLLKKAKKPVVYVGGGVINSGHGAAFALRSFAKLLGAPVTSTLMGLGAYPANDKLFVGMLGMHGAYEANRALHECDVMLNVGARFDDRVTGKLDGFSPNSKKIHIDIDAGSINKLVEVDVGLVADAEQALLALIEEWSASTLDSAELSTWWKTIKSYQDKHCFAYQCGRERLKPQEAIHSLWQVVEGHNPIISTEVGQHQMWAAQFCRFDNPNRWLTSGGLGTMGYGLPAAIGAQMAHPESLVIDVAGEASIQMNIQELATLVQYDLPVKVFVVNNQRMGMVRQWQDMHFEGRRSQSYGEALPDFVALAESYGLLGLRVERPQDFDAVVQQMLAHNGPVVVECMVTEDENCFPMIPSGANHNEMVLTE